ncbi:MAG: hypothetical protein WAQ99_00835 [Pyrinomonadaceae bacterium]
MPKKSKWLEMEFAPADFYNPHNITILTDVLTLIEDAAYRSMLDEKPELLVEAVNKISFPPGCPYTPLRCFNLTYAFEQAPALSDIAELLWYLYVSSKAKMTAHAKIYEKAKGQQTKRSGKDGARRSNRNSLNWTMN